ncbi:MAG: GNAT family N-acetyltransferase [Mycobacteriales bacterium]
MLQGASGLPPTALRAIADLERRVRNVDGGRLKLEWGALNSRSGRQVEDLLWWDGEQLLGFLGMYSFGSPVVELAGMVDPTKRRRGIAGKLLDAALPLCAERGQREVLLIVPRSSTAGRALALGRGAALDHSEHALVLLDAPSSGPSDPRTSLRPATRADTARVSELLAAAFGHAPSELAERLASPEEQTLLVERDGSRVGTLRLTRRGEDAGVYGLAVDPAWQGRGIGGDVLRRVCSQLRAAGARRIGLEVAVDNDRALGLYTAIGFTQVMTEDYYALPVA